MKKRIKVNDTTAIEIRIEEVSTPKPKQSKMGRQDHLQTTRKLMTGDRFQVLKRIDAAHKELKKIREELNTNVRKAMINTAIIVVEKHLMEELRELEEHKDWVQEHKKAGRKYEKKRTK